MPLVPPPWPPPDEEVRQALAAAYADGSWGKYDGPHGQLLAARLREMHQVEHVLLCSSGTIAVELALRGLKVGPGDEVILGGYDFPGNFRAVEAIGARPVLVDLAGHGRPHAPREEFVSRIETPTMWHLDPEQVKGAISPQTRAVIASHLHGSLAPM